MATRRAKGPDGKAKRFADEYLVDCNATRAYIAAGYKAKDNASAATLASRLLKNDQVAAYIKARQVQLAAKLGITQERVLAEYAKIAFSDMRKFVEWGPTGIKLLDSKELADGEAVVVAEVSETTSAQGGSLKFKLHDKKGALDSLAKHLGLLVERKQIDVKGLQLNELLKLVPEAIAALEENDSEGEGSNG